VAKAVLDASALLALLNQETGSEAVADTVSTGVALSAVSLSEVIAKLAESGMPEAVIREVLDPLGIEVVAFGLDMAYETGLLRPGTKAQGLSLGDRACLALAQRLGLSAVTADRAWAVLDLGVTVRVIR